MNVGDYVRIEGIITKVKHCCSDKDNWYFTYDLPNGCEIGATLTKRYKSSPNIIDLIEVGDYVNGEKVTNINGILYVKNIGALEEINIKSIVIKEQFESMEYKVGE